MVGVKIYKKLLIGEKEFSEGAYISLILKDGRKINGVICDITDNTISLKSDDITFYKVNIRQIYKRDI